MIALALCHCASAPPAPTGPPAAPPPPLVEADERVIDTVRVTASALNVRREPSTESDVLTQVKRGTALSVLKRDEGWTRVRLADDTVGWVASRFVARKGEVAARQGRKGCPADSDYAFIETPALSFAENGPHGLVVVEVTVAASGEVTRTKVISNSTNDESLAFLAEREIRQAKFAPPIRNCSPRPFVFTYRRTF